MSGIIGPATSPSTSAAPLMHQLNATASGYSLLPSSARDVVLFPLRVLYRAETFAFRTVPRSIARLSGLENLSTSLWGGAAATVGETGLADGAAAAATRGAADIVGEGVADAVARGEGFHFSDLLQTMRKLGGFFSYLTSLWSFACLIEALVLNRIAIYASTRRHLRLGWERRLALRIIPIILFVTQILVLLRGIRCQTSPNYGAMRYGKPGKRLIFDYAGGGGALYSLSSKLLSWESDQQSCSAVKMGRLGSSSEIPYGSYSILWPVFMVLCLSHFVETLSCALQGRAVLTEAGMSIFEHSLAFAEAESMISKSIGLGLFGLPKQSPLSEGGSAESPSPLQMLTRSQVLERMNVTPELLLIALISCSNSLTSHVLDVFGKQSNYRLLNTAFWGFCFMAAMVWGFYSGSPVNNETGVLKFPTVCSVGFVPHMLVLAGIVTCLAIYGLALVITAFSLDMEDSQTLTLRERFSLAHENMQGSNQIRSIRINRHDDFYTTLLRIGYVALTAASEAVFLNEGKAVIARSMTWLEEDRLAEIEASRQKSSSYGNWPNQADGGPPFDAAGFASFDVPQAPSAWESGYNKEKKIEKPKNGSRSMRSQAELGGVGAVRGAVRCAHGISFFRAIFMLLGHWIAYWLSRLLDRLGINTRPRWLKPSAGSRQFKPGTGDVAHPESLDFWILTEDGELELPEDHEFDVELEMRKRERSGRNQWEGTDELRLDDKLYGWWKLGGSWGNQDHTSDYNPPVDDDDTTSMVSVSTNATDSEWEDYASDGRRTPTQTNPYPTEFSRESTPSQDTLIDMGTLARLLDPHDHESRQEARILAAHLSLGKESSQIMTRSRYQKQVERERSRILLSSRLINGPSSSQSSGTKRKPTQEEESEMLEHLILSRRAEKESLDPNTWESGATGLPNGPPCVVCQTNPRAIITWPCRCLCICEDCRVSLAMNNFGSCVTCRQEVGGFMRLWVP
ncbi:hypothetical protein N7474_007686 [Penicillium riverlandense]|uniref:uncharacterized protein n=1 Tax=Penicillium riverlandense TaxID=1903569 RepID=UPI002548E396|nr:uncharacterized protein N7474_007686 [Penicillium riverlandense]KAJ5811385.1 hypothetical protein N7474_007686 [Penicillium riverlandense]